MEKRGSRIIALLVALVAGAVGYLLTSDPLMAPNLALVYGLGVWLTLGYYDEIPDGARGGENWDVAKWNGVLVAVVTAGAFTTMNVSGVPLDTGFAQALVLYGVAWIGYIVGVAQLTAADDAEAKAPDESIA